MGFDDMLMVFLKDLMELNRILMVIFSRIELI
jgi:hypothetical protein